MSFITFKNVTKIYKSGQSEVRALKNVSFKIEKSSFSVVLGPSGSGKSTLLNLLGGMDNATEGSILVGNKDVSQYNDEELTQFRRREIGFVFQFYNIIPNLTAFENVDMAYRLCNKTNISSEKAIEAVGLQNRMMYFPSQLSGGELQRVAIARALSKNPELMLCDEPTGALDSETGKRVLVLLHQMSRKYNTTVIIVTHNSAIAPMADNVIRLKDGEIHDIAHNSEPISAEEVIW